MGARDSKAFVVLNEEPAWVRAESIWSQRLELRGEP